MRQVQISRERHAACARRRQEDEQILPTELRDPDIVRAKQLMNVARLDSAARRGETTT
jgi:hypothetical protein